MYYLIRVVKDGVRLPKPEIVGFTDEEPRHGKPLRVAYIPTGLEDVLPPTDWVCDQRTTAGTCLRNIDMMTKASPDGTSLTLQTGSDIFLLVPGILRNAP